MLSAFAFLTAAALVAAAGYLFHLDRKYDSAVQTFDKPLAAAADPQAPRPAADEDATTILIVGTDGKGGSGDSEELPGVPDAERADTIMLANISSEGTEVVSILRDLWVDIPGHGEHKINAAYSLGGMPTLAETVEGLFETRIDHAAAIDLAGFTAIGERLGTIEVDSPKSFTTRDGIDIEEGPQQMDAETAEAFVRERRAFDDGDEQRARNQQALVTGVIDSLGVSDAHQASGLIEDFGPHVTVDEELSSVVAAGLLIEARPISFSTAPHTGPGVERHGQDVLYPDYDAYTEIGAEWRAN